jgi:hypothetical protein
MGARPDPARKPEVVDREIQRLEKKLDGPNPGKKK